MSNTEDNVDHLVEDFLDRKVQNEPDTTIYTDPETFGTDAGKELDKAFPENNDKQNE